MSTLREKVPSEAANDLVSHILIFWNYLISL